MDGFVRVPVSEQDPKVRATNFDEVCLGYTLDEAMEEASRCLNCKNAQCVKGCPVSIQIPDFVQAIKEGDMRRLTRLSASLQRSRLSVDVSALRRASARENVSAASRAIPSPSVSWSVSPRTGRESMHQAGGKP